jgi:uncharacterized FlgJ-related protein
MKVLMTVLWLLNGQPAKAYMTFDSMEDCVSAYALVLSAAAILAMQYESVQWEARCQKIVET